MDIYWHQKVILIHGAQNQSSVKITRQGTPKNCFERDKRNPALATTASIAQHSVILLTLTSVCFRIWLDMWVWNPKTPQESINTSRRNPPAAVITEDTFTIICYFLTPHDIRRAIQGIYRPCWAPAWKITKSLMGALQGQRPNLLIEEGGTVRGRRAGRAQRGASL